MSWAETAMVVAECAAAVCAAVVCGPVVLACARRLVLGDEALRARPRLRTSHVLGCDEPNCPYYKKNVRYLMVPAASRPHNSPSRR